MPTVSLPCCRRDQAHGAARRRRRRGDFTSAVLEFGGGLAVVAVLHADALLIVLVQPATNVAPSCSTCVDTAQPSLVCFSPVRR